MRFFVLFSIYLFCFSAQSDETIRAKYGPEFSFTTPEILRAMSGATNYNNPVNVEILRNWKEMFEQLCVIENCIVSKTSDKHGEAYRVKFNDDFWFQAGVDTGCLEVQTSPSTVQEFKSKEKLLNKFIWDTGKTLGLKPHKRIGGGHINMDLTTAFPGNNALLFRNFIVDQANSPELTAGIFGNHTGNSPPISALEPHLHDVFKEVIQIFDETHDRFGGLDAIDHLGREVTRRVYVSNPFWLNNNKKVWDPDYYQHMNFRNAKTSTPENSRRLELRGYRPQQSLKEFILELEFLDARLNYLNELNTPIPVNIPSTIHISKENKIKKFKKMAKESGLDLRRFKYFYKYDFEEKASLRQSRAQENKTFSPLPNIRNGVHRFTCFDYFKRGVL